MSDIVERLRSGAACWGDLDGTCEVKNAQSGCGCAEVADTITTLRAEVERLTAVKTQYQNLYDREAAENATLRADKERMRAALEGFACDCTINGRCAVPDNCPNFLARRALAQEKPNGLRPDRRTNVAERLFGDD